MRTGRPTKYKAEYAEQARGLCENGATDAQLAEFFDVSVRTIHGWKNQFPEFLHALKPGKEQADGRVERSLYERATGYTYDAVKIFPPRAAGGEPVIVPYQEHVPPDTTAAIFWLKNRKSAEWRDKQEHDHSGTVNVSITGDDAKLL